MRIIPFFFLSVFGLFNAAFAQGEEANVQLSVEKDGSFRIAASMWVEGDRTLIWNVLTDYNRLHEFISFVKNTLVLERADNHAVISQRIKSHFLFFSKQILLVLDIKETPMRMIEFEDQSKDDFSIYKGNWLIEGEKGGRIYVRYHLHAKEKFFAPKFVAKSVLKNDVQSYLGEVQKEVLRRRRHPPSLPS